MKENALTKNFERDLWPFFTFPDLNDAKSKLLETIQGLSVLGCLYETDNKEILTAIFFNDCIIALLIVKQKAISFTSYPINSIQSVNINILTERENAEGFFREDETKKALKISFIKSDDLSMAFKGNSEKFPELLSFYNNLLKQITK